MFVRVFVVTFGVVLGALAAVLVVGGVAFVGYSLYTAEQARRVAEQDQVTATAVTRDRATATARRAEEQATATTRQATVVAVREAARQCQDPSKITVVFSNQIGGYGNTNYYHVYGTVRNSCNFGVQFYLELKGLAENNSTIIATKKVALNSNGEGSESIPSTGLLPGEERAFRALFVIRPSRDIAYVYITPVVVREGDPI
jgi:hypothetical protein